MRAPSARRRAGLSLFVFEPGELDDEDGVLGSEADEHDQANLRVDIVTMCRAIKALGRPRARRRACQTAR